LEVYLTPPEQEFESYFTRYRGAVMGFALRRVPPEEAQDVVSETFLVAWRRRDTIPAEPLPWLLGVARNVITTRQRGHRRLTNLFRRLHQRSAGIQLDNVPVDRIDLAGAFNSLTEKDQEVLMLIGWEGLTVTQAAEVLRCTPQSVSLRLHRARKRLETRMASDAPFLSRHPIPNTEEAR
jgi:RNA polymerase sigma-70 factor, ECF subfamily